MPTSSTSACSRATFTKPPMYDRGSKASSASPLAGEPSYTKSSSVVSFDRNVTVSWGKCRTAMRIVFPRVLAAAAALAVGEVERQQALGEGAVGDRFVLRRVVGADAARDRCDDDIVVRSDKERAGVARAVVAIDDAVRRRAEAVVRIAREHRAGIDDERARHRRRPDPVALGGAHFEARELRLRQERDEVVVGVRREAELVVLGRRVRRGVDQPDRAVRLGEGLGEKIGREIARQREQRNQPRRHRLHRPVVCRRRGAELWHVLGPSVEPDERLFVDDVGVVGGAVAGDVEALAEIRPGVLVDRRMTHDLPAERQVADVVLADLERELVPFGTREEFFGDGEGVVDQPLRHAVLDIDEKAGVPAGAGDGTRQRCRRSRRAGEIRADIEHRNAALSEAHVRATLSRLAHTGGDRHMAQKKPTVYEFVPTLGQLRDDVLFGDVWEHPDLSKRDRSLITVAMLAALYRTDEMRGHMQRALDNGVTETELKGVITHVAFYAGRVSAVGAHRLAIHVFGPKCPSTAHLV